MHYKYENPCVSDSHIYNIKLAWNDHKQEIGKELSSSYPTKLL